jgi:hypothetical protein
MTERFPLITGKKSVRIAATLLFLATTLSIVGAAPASAALCGNGSYVSNASVNSRTFLWATFYRPNGGIYGSAFNQDMRAGHGVDYFPSILLWDGTYAWSGAYLDASYNKTVSGWLLIQENC